MPEQSDISPGEKAWAYFLATMNVAAALDADDRRARRSLNKVIKANKLLRHDLAWPFEKLDRADMVRRVRDHWWEFGEILDALEEQYGIEYEEESEEPEQEEKAAAAPF